MISGNTGVGVTLSDSGTSSNIVAGNPYWHRRYWTVALPNYYGGIDILKGASSNRRFDGTSPDAGSVALESERYFREPVRQRDTRAFTLRMRGPTLNVIAGNYVGVNSAGTAALRNSGVGVYLANGAQNNRIGSDGNGVMDSSEGNVISGNAYQGVVIQGTSSGFNTTGNIVEGNYIGVNTTGMAVLANGGNGILIEANAQSNRIGTNGTDTNATSEDNVIAGNNFNGIEITDAGTNSNLVAGNWIGTNSSGTSLPDAQNGVDVANGAENNQVGGSAALANMIIDNTGAGVAVTDAGTTGNSIRFDKIYNNGGLAIDLGDTGVQVNHAGSTTGPNNLQNYTLITAATPGSTTIITGTLNSVASTTYTLDFYADTTPDITFYGPGEICLGSMSVSTNVSGIANFTASLTAVTTTGEWVTATATDPSGNTSEFAGDRQLPYTSTSLNTSSWTQLGPSAIAQSPEFTGPVMSGRVETAAADPTNPNVMYVAADGGGVWKTTDWLSTSPTWTPLTDAQSSTVTGSGDYTFDAMAVYAKNPPIIYAAAAGPGGGVLKSTDGGQSWTLLGSSVFDQVAFGSLAVDPNNSNNVYVTVLYGPSADSGGVYKSTNGGLSWTNTTSSFFAGWASDVIIDPANSSILYAGLTQDFSNTSVNGMYESVNGGTSWSPLTSGLPTGTAVGDSMRIVESPSSPLTLYATIFESSDGLPHRFSSSNGGASWTTLNGLPTDEEDRFWHIMLAVDPSNPQVIYVNGDHTVYVSTNGGFAWTQINDSEDPVGGYFDDSGNFVLTGDHGVYKVTNVGDANYTFYNKQGNLGTSEFYTLTLDPTNANIVYGLAQDQAAPLKYMGYPVWNSTGEAPGGQDSEGVGEIGKILVDPTSPNKIYQYAPNDSDSFILSSTDGGATWANAGTGIPTTLAGYGLGYASQKAFVMDPTTSQRMLLGTDTVYETTNASGSWSAISPVLSSGNYVTALALAPSHTATIYAATSDGKLFVTTDDGGASHNDWTEVDTGLPKDFYDQIVSIQVDPNNASRAFIVPGRFPTNVFGSSNVWMTTTGGSSGWTNITGNLPSEDYTNGIAVDWRPATPVLYVATARGVYQSADLGTNWSRFGEGLPNSQVTDLQLATIGSQTILAVSTYGRGVWEIQLGAINRVWSGGSGTTSNWSDTNNWVDHTAPVAGDNVIFPAGASRLTNTNDLTAGTQLGYIVIGAGGYTISGNAIDLSGTVDGSASAGNTAFNLSMTLTGASSVLTGSTGSDITLGQAINTGGFTLSVGGAAGRADFTSNISGAGGVVVADGGGTTRFFATNSFGGGTTVTAGTLVILSAASILSGSNLTVGSGTSAAFGLPLPAPIVPDTAIPAEQPAPVADGSAAAVVAPTGKRVLVDASLRKPDLAAWQVRTLGAARPPLVTSPRQAGPRAVDAAIARQFAGSAAWLDAAEGPAWPDDPNRQHALSPSALAALMAQYSS